MAAARPLTLELTIRPPLTRADLPGLYARVCRMLTIADPVLFYCDVSEIVNPDAVSVDALARLALAARRHGTEIRLRGAVPALRELVELMGLGEVLREA